MNQFHTIMCVWSTKQSSNLIMGPINPYICVLVHNLAVVPGLTLPSCEDINGAHFHHGCCKLISPSCTKSGIVPHNPGCRTAGKKSLIWCKQAMMVLQISIVLVIKPIWCKNIKWHRNSIIVWWTSLSLPLCCYIEFVSSLILTDTLVLVWCGSFFTTAHDT